MKRIYINTPFLLNEIVSLPKETYHYLVRVLRCRNNERLCLFNGDGNDYIACLHIDGKKSASVEVLEQKKNNNESLVHITLIQGLSKGDKMDFVMQKAVELGVNEIIPVRTDFCAVKLDDERMQKKMQHWQSVIISACEQSERATIPLLQPVQSFADMMNLINGNMGGSNTITEEKTGVRIVLHPYKMPQNTEQFTNGKKNITSATIMIGPEGGLSDDEVEQAIDNGFVAKIFGKRILRTETATIVALSYCQQQWGDF